jgi:hypothetical protein
MNWLSRRSAGVQFTLDTYGGWIYREGPDDVNPRRVCWLPHERRHGGKIASSGERVCIGAMSGMVTILDFSGVNHGHSSQSWAQSFTSKVDAAPKLIVPM